eukprot:GHVH01003581.1.p1 GENE.GHVH01003581.1~~GHVH01003581.1.p1  ORF type:complete len:744 (-),score=94.85 GHVH01003581.1:21-2252(-)
MIGYIYWTLLASLAVSEAGVLPDKRAEYAMKDECKNKASRTIKGQKTIVDHEGNCNLKHGNGYFNIIDFGDQGYQVDDVDKIEWKLVQLQDYNYQDYVQNMDKIVGGYFAEWAVYKLWAKGQYYVESVPFDNLTHMIYAFFPVCAPYEYFPQLGLCTENDCLDVGPAPPGENGPPWTPFHNLLGACGYGCNDWDIAIHDPWASLANSCSNGGWGGPGVMDKIAYKKQQKTITTKIIPSIGGWTLSKSFFYLGNEDNRAKFIRSVRAFLLAFDFFDGVDIDWEFPGGGGNDAATEVEIGNFHFENDVPVLDRGNSTYTVQVEGSDGDRETYTKLMKDLRAMLNDLGSCSETKLACWDKPSGNNDACACANRYYELSGGISAGNNHIAAVDYGTAIQYMDHLFLMSYDFAGGWDLENLDHQTNPYHSDRSETYPTKFSAQSAVNDLITQGVPSEKIIVGVGKYGRGWNNVTKKDSGSPSSAYTFIDNDGQQADGVNYFDGSYHGADFYYGEGQTQGQMKGVIDYTDIDKMIKNKTCKEFYDDCAQAPFVECAIEGQTKVLTYDNPRSIMAKGKLVSELSLGGLFSWSLDTDNGDLLNAMNEAVGNQPKSGSSLYTKFNQSVYDRPDDCGTPGGKGPGGDPGGNSTSESGGEESGSGSEEGGNGNYPTGDDGVNLWVYQCDIIKYVGQKITCGGTESEATSEQLSQCHTKFPDYISDGLTWPSKCDEAIANFIAADANSCDCGMSV